MIDPWVYAYINLTDDDDSEDDTEEIWSEDDSIVPEDMDLESFRQKNQNPQSLKCF